MRRRHGAASHSDDGDGSTLWLTLVCNYFYIRNYELVVACLSHNPGSTPFHNH